MPAKQKKFPNPPKPYSLKQIVKKIMANRDYAKFIHGQLRKARKGDAAAAATLAAHFKPQPSELKALNVKPRDLSDCDDTNPTTNTNMMIDFAAHV
jgi:hypothetical protein